MPSKLCSAQGCQGAHCRERAGTSPCTAPQHRMSAMSAAAAPPTKRARPAALEARVSTVALPSLGKIYAIAVAKDGTTFVATASALFIVTPTGHHALLAGSRTKAGYKDCQGDKARFDGRPASQWRRTAACWWPTATTTACACVAGRHGVDRRPSRAGGLGRWAGRPRAPLARGGS